MLFEERPQGVESEIAQLEARLHDMRAQLDQSTYPTPPSSHPDKSWTLPSSTIYNNKNPQFNSNTTRSTSLHALLLLSDSALPLGSFAFSSGLESYLAHNKSRRTNANPVSSFHHFLKLSIASIASTSLPYVLAAYRHPQTLDTLDNDLDASTPCVVAQRASVAQGRALIGVWERAFRASFASPGKCMSDNYEDAEAKTATSAIDEFSDALKSSFEDVDEYDLGPRGHFAPLWGVVCRAMGLDLQQTAYTFVLNHAKAVLSAAVRASVMGPYQAQNILASQSLQDTIMARIEREWNTEPEEAGQVVPALDLWIGRHELLYSRIFNS
ncbi:Urease accessory protein UreF [Penicillium argentinense]|uniref:Urease accessory protein UreF n=1 Tax=Penicillium argentinense TaxID=1131581 RepID=A0A9W9G0F3_9EURO|nr:Urease accessory protein UreF [Penicillium argentinense]KAJ5109839.1 Urease accessory protein UreF [Penicillium argentinense]